MSSHSRSPDRGRSRTRTPSRDGHRSLNNRSPRRSISPRSASRSPVNGSRRGERRGRSYSRSVSRSPRRDRSGAREAHSPVPAKSSKIVVEKLTKNVTDAHIQEIFGSYGEIQDLDMPINRQFNINRGTAYIIYESATAAESAIAHMHEAQLDGAAISVSIVLPRRKFSQSPPPARRGPPTGPAAPPIRNGPPIRDFDRPPPPRYGPPGGGRHRSPNEFRSPGGYRSPPGRYRSPPPRRGSPPPRRFGGPPPLPRDGRYRQRSFSRERSPARRSRSRSFSSRSRSRSPPGRGGYLRRDSPPPRRRRSPSYSSYSSSRSRSRDGRRR